MCSDETHINFFVDEQHDSYYSVGVTLDVEYVTVVANIVYCIKCLLYVSKISLQSALVVLLYQSRSATPALACFPMKSRIMENEITRILLILWQR